MHSPLQSPLQPVMRSPLEFRRRGGFNPESLFRNGEVGVYYDPSDLSTLFQDSAGTTPVTAAGQPVGLMLDAEGNRLNGYAVVVGDKCSIVLREYPVCLSHEVRHCFEGSWHPKASATFPGNSDDCWTEGQQQNLR